MKDLKAERRPSAATENVARPPVVSLVNLGCAKNLVDSERVLGTLAEAGFLIAQDPAEAELCLVNTCGFIAEAREETAAVLDELAQLREDGRLKVIVALGCLVERVAALPQFARFVRAADVRLGFSQYPRIAEICRELIAAARSQEPIANSQQPIASSQPFLLAPRLRIGAPHTAYLKISEGCSNPCQFCSIPRMRGRQVSRPIEAIVAEARQLAEGGAREIVLIAQDTTSYGRDLYGRFRLPDLLRALLAVSGARWFRLMYAYPRHLTGEVLDVLAGDERFCPYIDLPLQHIADPILRAMGRGVTRKQTIELLDMVARKLPGGAIRTAFIVGFPGETEAQFQELLDFVKEGRFAHAGVFLYSHEPQTAAARMPDALPPAEKEARRKALMLVQRDLSRRRLQRRVGQTLEVLVDGAPAADCPVRGARAVARSRLEAPEVDGVVYLRGRGASRLTPGMFKKVEIVRAMDYDVVADV
ncbi:MAG: 30S ribosomal protein S12 methylthiotransferase RimO [Planctomycetota bacterium]|nr:30S ribosomal protein S12 methylthiotransferase RimO [Planctomycetota bacterium]